MRDSWRGGLSTRSAKIQRLNWNGRILLALARKPTEEETRAAKAAMDQMTADWERQLEKDKPAEPVRGRARWLALVNVCYTLMNSAEFLYID
jgi:hypothetical protein